MKPKVKTLKNGLRIVTVPMKDNPTVTVLVMVEAGTRYETRDTNGLSHFLEHMCFKGTTKRGNKEIAYELEAMGAETNAFTWYDYTGYYAKARADLFPKLLDVVSDVYLNSLFPEAEIEKERGVICGEIDMYEDMPKVKVHDLMAQSLFGDQPIGFTTLGPKENINRFTRKDFIKYHQKHYVAEKTVVVVTGNCESVDVEKQVMQAFKEIAQGKRIEKKKVSKNTGDRIVIKNKKTDQAHIMIGLRTIPMNHPDAAAYTVMNAILGQGMSSRLFIKLREEMGAGYYIQSSYNSSNDSADHTISTGTEPRRVPEIINAILWEIKKISSEQVPERELVKTKEYLIGTIVMGLESSDATAFHIAHQAILHQKLKTPKDIEKEIRKVTTADVLRVAKKYLKPERLHGALLGPYENLEDVREAFQFK